MQEKIISKLNRVTNVINESGLLEIMSELLSELEEKIDPSKEEILLSEVIYQTLEKLSELVDNGKELKKGKYSSTLLGNKLEDLISKGNRDIFISTL